MSKKAEKKRKEAKEMYIVLKVRWSSVSDTAEEDHMLWARKNSFHLVILIPEVMEDKAGGS